MKKAFVPTKAQDQKRKKLLSVFNAPFPAVRHTIYRGAIWAGTLIPRPLIVDRQTVIVEGDMQAMEAKVRRGEPIGYSGIYSKLALELGEVLS